MFIYLKLIKCIKKPIIILICLFTSSNVLALELPSWDTVIKFFCPIPYIGVNAQSQHVDLEKRYGRDLYNRRVIVGGIAAGVYLCDYLALEVSGDIPLNKRKNKNVRLNEGEFFPGDSIPLELGTFEDYKTKLTVDSLNFDAIGYIPLCFINFTKTKIFGSFGASILRIYAKQTFLGHSFPEPITEEERSVFSAVFRNAKRRVVPHVRVGVEQSLLDCLDLRVFLDWKKMTSLNLKGVRSVGRPTGKPRLKFHNKVSCGIGIVYRFW